MGELLSRPLALTRTPAKIWRKQSANITSPISRTGRTPPPLNAPLPAWKKICARASANKAPEGWRSPKRFARFDCHRETRQRLGLRRPSAALSRGANDDGKTIVENFLRPIRGLIRIIRSPTARAVGYLLPSLRDSLKASREGWSSWSLPSWSRCHPVTG